ncbi:SGNH/GDSL hydrolase family protein [bacterium]|nr:SGNH/GDSL hydrolase family protein [bacterium]
MVSAKCKIVFYGASVTQQRNGYADCFAKLSKANVLKLGFGGMHLNDAGICLVDKAVQTRPDICFIDWFSTYYIGQDNKTNLYIDAIAEKLLKIGCRVIFLFCARNKDLKISDWKKFYSETKNYLKNKRLEYIPLDEILSGYPIEEILRDEIHTTKKGSQLYAEAIFHYLQQFADSPHENSDIKPNIYSSLSALPVKRGFAKEVILEGDCHIQGFFLKIGPWSGIVDISTSNLSKKENTWDWWCYYGRDHFSFNLPIDGRATFTISDEAFDTSECRDKFDFSKYKKKLVIHEIYYYGGSLKLCTKGSRFSYLYALLMSKVFAAKHRFKVIFGINS